MKTLIEQFTQVAPLDLNRLLAMLHNKKPNMDGVIRSNLLYSENGRTIVKPPASEETVPTRMQFECTSIGQIMLEVIRRTPNPPAPDLVHSHDLALITIQFLRHKTKETNVPLTLLVPFSDEMFKFSPRAISIEAAYLSSLGAIFEEYRTMDPVKQAWVQTELLAELDRGEHTH